jgi:hypothetical protein
MKTTKTLFSFPSINEIKKLQKTLLTATKSEYVILRLFFVLFVFVFVFVFAFLVCLKRLSTFLMWQS